MTLKPLAPCCSCNLVHRETICPYCGGEAVFTIGLMGGMYEPGMRFGDADKMKGRIWHLEQVAKAAGEVRRTDNNDDEMATLAALEGVHDALRALEAWEEQQE
tara:strand:- start:8 stop:316 length:309 start_codon:yes stop_codon:yes gene_type:complete